MRSSPGCAGVGLWPGQQDPPIERAIFIAAAAVIVTIPVVALVLVFQRRIVAGLTNGAVKG